MLEQQNDKNSNKNQQDVLKHILHNLSTTPSKASSASSESSSYSAPWMHDEDATILDVFGQVAKEVLTNRMVSSE